MNLQNYRNRVYRKILLKYWGKYRLIMTNLDYDKNRIFEKITLNTIDIITNA